MNNCTTLALHIGGSGNEDAQVNGKPLQCQKCPLYRTGKGFVPGTYQGQPLIKINPQGLAYANDNVRLNGTPLLGFCGEAPAMDELIYGRPFVGRAGGLLNSWVFANAGISFENAVVDNVIRCVQPDNKLPGKPTLVQAIQHCSQYDRWKEMNLAADVLSFHPAALLRDPVPLPLVIHDVGKAREIVMNEGNSARVLLGATALMKFYPFTSVRGVAFWRGHVHRPAGTSNVEKGNKARCLSK